VSGTGGWRGRKVLVTGAGGFIGSHLVERLVLEGAEVTALLRYNSRNAVGHLNWLPADARAKIRLYPGDLRDGHSVDQACAGQEVIFHLAAIISIPYSYVHPGEAIETNVMGTFNVLAAARSHKTKRVVLTSSSEVYGTARIVPIREDHPLQGQSPYSASKIAADKIAESFHLAYGMPIVVLRPFNTYGPRQSARAVIPTIITQALRGQRIRLGSTHPTRDLTFVTDTVAAFLRAGAATDIDGRVINAGSGFEISVGDLAAKILELMGKSGEIVADEQRLRPAASEVERLWADNDLARELLDWKPSVALEEGLRQTIEWISLHLDLYEPGQYQI
jgi:NAD dependent epimerase/dehydratase